MPDDDPLASYKADFVWESPDGCQTVCFYGRMKTPPKNTTATQDHGGDLTGFQFYSRMKVVTEQGKTCCFDLNKATNDVAVVEYGEDDSGDAVLIYADILGMYTIDNEPWIEHGYFYDLAKIERDKACRFFLKNTEKGQHGIIEEKELVNSAAVYHSPAEVVQGIATIRYGVDDDCLPIKEKTSRRDFYWRRVLDVSTNKEVSVSKLAAKMLRLPRQIGHPANAVPPTVSAE